MKILRNALGMVLLLAVAGCGCSDDSSGDNRGPNPKPPNFGGGIRIKPIPVAPPPPKPVDILCLLDDAAGPGGFNGFLAGDLRAKTKSQLTQEVMRAIVARLEAQLLADPRTKDHTFDLAFGVARFEDWGGPWRLTLQPNATQTDPQSRPFILQQPILRQAFDTGNPGEDFQSLLFSALARETPGRGDLLPTPQNNFWTSDSNTALEALFQAATGQGFDGNGLLGTGESGLAGALTTQLTPGTSGDVPQPQFAPLAPDNDGKPLFRTGGGAFASGNLGGVGWRPDSCRYIVVASDFASVAPFNAAIPPRVDNIPDPAVFRLLREVASRWFASFNFGVITDQRFGTASTVGPVGRAAVSDAVDALNALDIEVLCIGTQQQADRGGKPNQPGNPAGNLYPKGPIAAVTDAILFGSPDPIAVPGDPGPFTWMSAVSSLTGAYDDFNDDKVYDSATDMPLVYNLLTIHPDGGGAVPAATEVEEDLVDRIALRVGALPPPVDLNPLSVDITMVAINAPGFDPYNLLVEGLVPVATNTATIPNVLIPKYLMGGVPPADVIVAWAVNTTAVNPPAVGDPPVAGRVDVTFLTSVPIPGFTAPTALVDLTTFPTPGEPRADLFQVVATADGCFSFVPVDSLSNVGPGQTEYCANFP